jgi:hypothetical protein
MAVLIPYSTGNPQIAMVDPSIVCTHVSFLYVHHLYQNDNEVSSHTQESLHLPKEDDISQPQCPRQQSHTIMKLQSFVPVHPTVLFSRNTSDRHCWFYIHIYFLIFTNLESAVFFCPHFVYFEHCTF